MPATLGRLPVRVSVGDGAPVEVGTWEITATTEGRLTVSTASFADVLREAANNIAPDPALSAAYRERARLVAFLAALYPAVIAHSDPDAPGWPVITIDTPAGQMSWHLAPDDLDLFPESLAPRVHPEDPRAKWDGHSTDEKHERLVELTARTHYAHHKRG